MDLLFKRYASPFDLLELNFENGTLNELLNELFRRTMKEHNDSQIWEMWLHKVYDKTFDDFKGEIEIDAKAIQNRRNGTSVMKEFESDWEQIAQKKGGK